MLEDVPSKACVFISKKNNSGEIPTYPYWFCTYRDGIVLKKSVRLTSFHPVIDEPPIPLNLIHDTQISPLEETINGRPIPIQNILNVQIALLRRGDVPQDVMIFNHGTPHVTNDHDHLINTISPAPISLVVRIIGLDEGMVGRAVKYKVPLVAGRPSRQRLHLRESHALVARGEAGDQSLVEINVCGHRIFWSLPSAVSATEVQRKPTL